MGWEVFEVMMLYYEGIKVLWEMKWRFFVSFCLLDK